MIEVLSKAVEEKIYMEPAYVERPSIRYDLADPLERGDVVVLTIEKNGEQIDAIKFCNEDASPEGEELRAFVQLSMTDMKAFSRGKDVAPVRTTLLQAGTLKEPVKDPLEEIIKP